VSAGKANADRKVVAPHDIASEFGRHVGDMQHKPVWERHVRCVYVRAAKRKLEHSAPMPISVHGQTDQPQESGWVPNTFSPFQEIDNFRHG
jgi:hypothetical protein